MVVTSTACGQQLQPPWNVTTALANSEPQNPLLPTAACPRCSSGVYITSDKWDFHTHRMSLRGTKRVSPQSSTQKPVTKSEGIIIPATELDKLKHKSSKRGKRWTGRSLSHFKHLDRVYGTITTEEKIKKILLVFRLLLRITIIKHCVPHCYTGFKIPRVILLLFQFSCDFRVTACSYWKRTQSRVLSLHQNYALDNYKTYLQHACRRTGQHLNQRTLVSEAKGW